MQWIKEHKLIVGLIVTIVFVGMWFALSGSDAPEPLLSEDVATTPGSPTADSADKQLVGTLLTLRAVTLTGTIFADPAFMSLQDFGTTIVPEPIGRANPFAPLSSGAATTTRTSQSAQLFGPRR